MPGYWLVRYRKGTDVREQGSGGTGATNVGRVLGGGGFALVSVLDVAKGLLAVWLAQHFFGHAAWVSYVCGLAVVLGHIWPALLGFRGGKGAATLLGVWLMLEPLALLLCLPVLGISWIFLRRFTQAGICAMVTLPFTVLWVGDMDAHSFPWALLCVAVVLFAHREHLRRWLFPGKISEQTTPP